MPYMYIMCMPVRTLTHDVHIIEALNRLGLGLLLCVIVCLAHIIIIMEGYDFFFVFDLQAEEVILGR